LVIELVTRAVRSNAMYILLLLGRNTTVDWWITAPQGFGITSRLLYKRILIIISSPKGKKRVILEHLEHLEQHYSIDPSIPNLCSGD
jgi:hypothetical protein